MIDRDDIAQAMECKLMLSHHLCLYIPPTMYIMRSRRIITCQENIDKKCRYPGKSQQIP